MKNLLIENLPKLRRFAFALTGNMADADDLVQNTVVKMLSPKQASLQPRLSLVFTVCKNLWIDEVRKRKVRLADEFMESKHSNVSHPGETGEETMQLNELINSVEALPDVAREVLSLVAVAGMSYAETAETLNIPIGTVMSRVSRARALLTERLGVGAEIGAGGSYEIH